MRALVTALAFMGLVACGLQGTVGQALVPMPDAGGGGGTGGGGGVPSAENCPGPSVGGHEGNWVADNVFPPSATVRPGGDVRLFTTRTFAAALAITDGGAGSLEVASDTTVIFHAGATSGTTVIVWPDYPQAVTTITVDDRAAPFDIVPGHASTAPWSLSLTGGAQTFAAVRASSAAPVSLRGVRGVTWFTWPVCGSADAVNRYGPNSGVPSGVGPTMFPLAATTFVMAREDLTGVWSMLPMQYEDSPESSITVAPDVSRAAPGATVQLTAHVSTGDDVTWTMVDTSSGTVDPSGQYTAPTTPGVYVVKATPSHGDGTRFALATIIIE